MSFAFPPEVWIELAKHLRPCDLIAAKLTCRHLYEIFSSRSVWLDQARMIQTRRPVPVSGRTGSVHDKTAQELEKACIRAGDIELNFAKDEPLDYHVKELYLEDTFTERAKRGAQPAKLFILEPAMYILCMYSDGRLALWDINRDGNVTTGQHVARVAGNVDVGITYTTYYTALNIVVHATLSVLVVSMVNSRHQPFMHTILLRNNPDGSMSMGHGRIAPLNCQRVLGVFTAMDICGAVVSNNNMIQVQAMNLATGGRFNGHTAIVLPPYRDDLDDLTPVAVLATPAILILVVQGSDSRESSIHFFNFTTIRAGCSGCGPAPEGWVALPPTFSNKIAQPAGEGYNNGAFIGIPWINSLVSASVKDLMIPVCFRRVRDGVYNYARQALLRPFDRVRPNTPIGDGQLLEIYLDLKESADPHDINPYFLFAYGHYGTAMIWMTNAEGSDDAKFWLVDCLNYAGAKPVEGPTNEDDMDVDAGPGSHLIKLLEFELDEGTPAVDITAIDFDDRRGLVALTVRGDLVFLFDLAVPSSFRSQPIRLP